MTPILTNRVMPYEEFDASIISCDGRTRLTAREKAPWIQDTLCFGDIGLQMMQEGGANTYEGETPAEMVTLCIGLPAPGSLRVVGFDLHKGRLVLARPKEEIVTCARDVSRYACLYMPVDRFIESVDRLDPRHTERLLSGSSHLEIHPAHWHSVVDLVHRVFATATDEAFHSRATRHSVVEEVISAFVEAVATSSQPKATGRPKGSRQRIVKNIREILNSPASSTSSVAEMAQQVEVPERTLRSVVTEQFGVTPKRLMVIWQLRNIHEALRNASPHETVTSIASRHGVWEFGRFAQRYHTLFGERPYETLRSGTRAA